MATDKARIPNSFATNGGTRAGGGGSGTCDHDSVGIDGRNSFQGSATYARFLDTNSVQLRPWSNPAAWADGKVPTSSKKLHVTLDGYSSMDLGTAQHPFAAASVTSANPQMALGVEGNFRVGDISVFNTIVSGNLVVTDGANSWFDVNGTGTLELKHDIGPSTFGFGGYFPAVVGYDATIILDAPPKVSFNNKITFREHLSETVVSQKIELAGVHFDHADFIPNAAVVNGGTLELTRHGSQVYQMTDVVVPSGGTFSVGVDPSTHYNYVSWSHA